METKRSSRVTVLLVDDGDFYRTTGGSALKSQGFEVLEVATFADAVFTFDSCSSDIQLLVTSISLCDGNGCSLAIALRKRKADLRVLFTAFPVGLEACKYYGLVLPSLHVLKKPFTNTQLVNRIRRLLNTSERFPYMHSARTSGSTSP
jgi:DNA-binding response OmpR family regulator